MEGRTMNDSALLLVGGLVLLVCAILFYVYSKSKSKKTGSFRKSGKAELESKLMNMVFGNRGTFERLITYEKNRNPGGTEEEHIQSAIERMINDRR